MEQPRHLGIINQKEYESLTEWEKQDRRIKELEKQNGYLLSHIDDLTKD